MLVYSLIVEMFSGVFLCHGALGPLLNQRCSWTPLSPTQCSQVSCDTEDLWQRIAQLHVTACSSPAIK